MIIRVPTDRKNDPVKFVEVPIDINFKFGKGNSYAYTSSLARLVEMSQILPPFCSFGGVVTMPGNEQSDLEYSIESFKNTALSIDETEYEIYKKEVEKRRYYSPEEFKDTTTYKTSHYLMDYFKSNYYKSIILYDKKSLSNYIDTYDGHLLVHYLYKFPKEKFNKYIQPKEDLQPGEDFKNWKKKFDNELKVMIGIPIYLRTDETFPLAFVWFFCFEDLNIDDSNSALDIKVHLNNWLNDISTLFSMLATPLSINYINNTVNSLKNHQVKSAIAAIMSRNMSHNIGSHVLSYLKNHLRSTKSMLDNVVFEDLIKKTENYFKADILENQKQFNFNVKEIHAKSSQDYSNAKFLIGLGRLLNYIQERQDFIATIASDSMPFFISVNFKDFIYDEINHDKKSERHSDSHEKELNLLLDNIARSEEIVRHKTKSEQKELVLKFRNFNGNRLPETNLSSKEQKMKEDLDEMRLFDIELPSGIMGRQAIFSIMENFIRNSAKHGGDRKDDLEIKLNISESDSDEEDNLIYPEFYKISISDNNRNANKHTYKTKKINVANNKEKEINLTVKELIDLAINDAVIEDGLLNDSYKGIKEMKISALWLRRLEPSKIEDSDIDPPLLDVSTDKDNNIVYSFYVYKPHKVAIISDVLEQSMNKQKRFAAQFDNKKIFASWKFYTSEEALSAESIPYNFVINYGSSLSYQELRKKIPVRYLDAKDFEEKYIEDILCNEYYNFIKEDFLDTQNKIEKYLYEEIYKLWLKKKNIIPEKQRLLIVDQKTCDKLIFEPLEIDTRYIEIKRSLTVETLVNFKPTIIFNKHNDTLSDYQRFKDDYLKENPEVIDSIIFVEGVSGGNSTDRLIRNSIKDDLWFYRIMEAAHISVLIIDERIWESYNREYCDVFRNKRIDILNIVEKSEGQFVLKDLEHKGDNEYNARIPSRGKLDGKKIKLPFKKYDFLLIHQGLIDKMTGMEDVNKTFNMFRNLAHFKLIHSGRSKPPKEQFPDNCAFVQFSSLQKALQDCKMSLVELLLSSIIEK